jgi:guanine deaminase
MLLSPAHLLYLVTRAGAVALNLESEAGDFAVGKSADFVYLRAPEGSPLEGVLRQADGMERSLAALFTLAGPESVVETAIGGEPVRDAAGA